jgi:hypothetical protein
MRKNEVTVDGQKRLVVMVRNLTDIIEADKVQIKLRYDNCSQKMISQELSSKL